MATPPPKAALEAFQVGFWLLKDVSWLLLVPYLSIPFGIAAVALQLGVVVAIVPMDRANLWHDMKASSTALLHASATLLWVCGNFVWMVEEVVFEPVVSDIDLGIAPLARWNGRKAAQLEATAKVIFTAGLVIFSMWVISSIHMGTPSAWNATRAAHSGLWLAKDVCWLSKWQGPAVVVTAVTIAVGFICVASRLSTCLYARSRDASATELASLFRECSLLCWLCGMAVWMLGELFWGDQTRRAACIAFIPGVAGLALGCAVGWKGELYLIISRGRRWTNDGDAEEIAYDSDTSFQGRDEKHPLIKKVSHVDTQK